MELKKKMKILVNLETGKPEMAAYEYLSGVTGKMENPKLVGL